MQRCCAPWWTLLGALPVVALTTAASDAACCYFSAKDQDISQPSQKVFITWDPVRKLESFTVQPKFAGNALDFGMVIPTPSQPKLDEMPRDFFKELAVFSIMKRREFPTSTLLASRGGYGGYGGGYGGYGGGYGSEFSTPAAKPKPPAVKVVETGVVGSLDYKIIKAERADDLHKWLKDNKYHYAGDEATLNFYVQKQWYFTVMKIDTMQMKKNKDGTYAGEVTPTRFQFGSDELVYPLKITQISVKDKTEALFYVQAPFKVDLPGEMSYQYQWVPMLQTASGSKPGLPGNGDNWLKAIKKQIPDPLRHSETLGFKFVSGQRSEPNKQGRTPTTMEWARRLNQWDIGVLQGQVPYSEKVPDPDAGFTAADLKDAKKAQAIYKLIEQRLSQLQKSRPKGYLVREAPAEEVRQLRLLLGHLQAGAYITKFRKIFTRDEMNDDLLIVRARFGGLDDPSEYEEMLPTSPP